MANHFIQKGRPKMFTRNKQIPMTIKLGVTILEFKNETKSDAMWATLLTPLIDRINVNDTLETIRQSPEIQATKQAYKALGKDPSRFRPSSDSLWRRVAKGKGLYQVNALVDLNNALSLTFKMPFGSYDLDKIQGDITLTKGMPGAQYPGIGKDMINIENLLVLADNQGPFGSPTSDSTTAMIDETTHRAAIIAYLFDVDNDAAAHIQAEVKATAETYLSDVSVVAQQIV